MESTSENNLPDSVRLIRQGWDQVANEYAADRTGIFSLASEKLLSLLNPPPRAKLLDVGTGSGIIVTRAASHIGPQGWVIGVDISATMLRLAQQHIDDLGLSMAEFCQVDAERLSFPEASFDAVTCAFSLFQFPDMNRALAEMRRVLKPKGEIGLSNWGVGYFSPLADMQRELFREFGLRPLLRNPITFMPEKLRLTLETAGFIEVQLEADEVDICFRDPQDAWDFNMSMGPFPMMLRHQLPPEKRERLHERFIEMLKIITSQRGVWCTFHPLYVVARKP